MKVVNTKSLLAAILLVAAAPGCKKARYGIVKPDHETNPKEFTDASSSFRFEATPGTVSPKEEVTFKGTCTTTQKFEITWDFGDKTATQSGADVKHAYDTIDTYTVTGTCSLANGKKLSATVKINVIDPTDDDDNPGQHPVQSTPVQNGPGQSVPTQSGPVQN